MKTSYEERFAKMSAHMKKHVGACPNCAGTQLTAKNPLSLAALIDGEAPLPAAPIVCDTCGHVRLFSVEVIGG